MTPVTIVGIAAGVLLILAAVAVFWSTKTFPAGGVMVTLVGLVLIGMSQWSSFKITAAGATLEAVRAEITQTAQAVDEVAAQAEQAAGAIEGTRQQLVDLADALEGRHVLPGAALQPIRTQLAGAPRIDVTKLATARANLKPLLRR